VTRDRLMVGLHDDWPAYDFATHKGYITAEHVAALAVHGPSPVHRMRFVNVRRAAGLEPAPDPRLDPATSLGPGSPVTTGGEPEPDTTEPDTTEEDA
jgi:ribonuclease HII